MASARKLKVYRTPIGFHDAYVAAPSQKAALAAWGSDHNLFARGVAEIVDDPDLTREPLDSPGTVIRRLRGTTAEQIAALPPDRPRPKQDAPEPAAPKQRAPELAPVKTAPPPKPKPDRAPLEAARAALDAIEARHRHDRDALAAREAALARARRKTERAQAAEIEKARTQAKHAQDAYDAAIRAWRG